MPDPADVAANHGGPIPHRLGYRETESFQQGLLDDHRRLPLQGINKSRVLVAQDYDPLNYCGQFMSL
jgi:hypothetical protein